MTALPFYLRLDHHSGVPLGVQIANGLRLAIVAQRAQAGSQLPSARDLAAELRVNFHTVRKAYGELEGEGLLEFRRGLGTFVGAGQKARMTELRRLVREHVQALLRDLAGVDLDPAELEELVHGELARLLPQRRT
jgi:GntR family transcriptional regulator